MLSPIPSTLSEFHHTFEINILSVSVFEFQRVGVTLGNSLGWTSWQCHNSYQRLENTSIISDLSRDSYSLRVPKMRVFFETLKFLVELVFLVPNSFTHTHSPLPLTNFSSLIHFPLLRYHIPSLHLVCTKLSPPALSLSLSLHRQTPYEFIVQLTFSARAVPFSTTNYSWY